MRPFNGYMFVVVIYKSKLDMSKRKTSVDIDDVMNDINAWVREESDDEAESDLHEVVGDEKEKIDPSAKNMLQDDIDLEAESYSPQNRYIFRKQLTKERLVHNIDCSLNEDNFEPIVYVNGKGQLEEFTGYLGPKKKTKTQRLCLRVVSFHLLPDVSVNVIQFINLEAIYYQTPKPLMLKILMIYFVCFLMMEQ